MGLAYLALKITLKVLNFLIQDILKCFVFYRYLFLNLQRFKGFIID